MDFYEAVVVDYLRADRALFLNTQCCIQLNPGANPDTSGPHWYCDAIAADFRHSAVFLCEISYSKRLSDLAQRLKQWHENWALVREALARDCYLPKAWSVRPWLFIPSKLIGTLLLRLDQIGGGKPLRFTPRVTTLEMVQPWHYRFWNREGEHEKPEKIPLEMRQ